MNNRHQETSLDLQERESGGGNTSSQRVIYFSSGETLEEEDSEEEEEQSSNGPPFTQTAKTTRLSFKNVAILIGRISLQSCDFLGERLAGALGLNAAKYQYAIDQYHQDHKTGTFVKGQTERMHLAPGLDGSLYGATGDTRGPAGFQGSRDTKRVDGNKGCHNRGYQADEDHSDEKVKE